MSEFRARKIEYVLHFDELDDEGNVIDELRTQEPMTCFAPQFPKLPDVIAQKLEEIIRARPPAESSP